METPIKRAQRFARNCLAMLDEGSSMLKVKIGLRQVLRDNKDLIPVFEPIYRHVRVQPFRDDLAVIVARGSLPIQRNTASPSTAPRDVSRLVGIIRQRFDYDPQTGVLVWRPGWVGCRPHKQFGKKGPRAKQIVIEGQKFNAAYVAWLHHHGTEPNGSVRVKTGADSLALKNLYVYRP